MKVYPAEYCTRRAIADGLVDPDTLVIETSSGTMAHGLAIVCALRQLRLTIVTDPACDPRLCRRLRMLGARVEVVPAPAAQGGYQRARLDRLAEIGAQNPRHWWVNQYDNPANAGAYAAVASQLVERLGRIDCLVGTVGSGGSVCGTGRHLRELFPHLAVVAVDTFGSVLFGQPDAPRKLRGLGNSLQPKNLDHSVVDEVHWVSAPEAFTATRQLYETTTLFRGPTSGACWLVARHYAATHPGARVVCLFPDDGDRYLDSVYDEAVVRADGLWQETLPEGPREVTRPDEARHSWSMYRWRRQSLADVVKSVGQVSPV
jgi:cysteine synthase